MKTLLAIFSAGVVSLLAIVPMQDSEQTDNPPPNEAAQGVAEYVLADGTCRKEVYVPHLLSYLTLTEHRDTEEKVIMLGVQVRRADGTLRRHLKIKAGMGLVLEQVVAGSAAEQAGLAVDDVLLRWGDQWLVNEDQLTTLVRNSTASEKVAIALMRDGNEQTVEVTLMEGTAAASSSWLDFPTYHFFAENLHQHMTDPRFLNCAACHTAPQGNFSLVPVLTGDKTKVELKPIFDGNSKPDE